ncbi:Putative succinate-semialdehyde dehydrogenase [NADP(+)] 2 [Mobiluncus curtisii]|uniref:Succinate-semialdehyde dehydrogenase [NADP(+)] 2 n=1 Tax=Mobiluncus curtisii TaxID=2051 RepID=A0A2X3BSR1_9ACTO|nr:Putative succinate-semialdehyde dehydrogenase [NADP(+)] 2 [Mobiluncus curtisii]
MSDTETETIYPSASAEAQARQMQQRCEASFRHVVSDLERAVGLPEGRPLRTVKSPFTGMDTLGVPQATLADLDQAIVRARAAGRRWGNAPAATRARFLYKLHDLLWEYSDEILDVIQWETGKSRYHAYDEIQDIALNCRYYARILSRAVREERRRGAFPGVTRTFVMYEPKGVVGVIAPWNYPLSMGITDAIAALAAGNAIVTKPDSNTPLSVVIGKVLMMKAGLDPDLFILVPGRGSELELHSSSRSTHDVYRFYCYRSSYCQAIG